MGWKRFFRRSHWDDERAREIEAHLALEEDDQVAQGVPRSEARAAALRRFGNPTRVREEIYTMNTIGWLDALAQDVRYALRVLRANRGFTAVAIVSLALGIGANSAIFELVNAVRLRSLPVADPERLVEVVFAPPRSRSGSFRGRRPELTYALWQEIESSQQAFSGIFAWHATRFNVAPGGEMHIVQGLYVSGGFFNGLGVRPMVGRVLTEADDRPDCASPGAVISHGFWQREYGGRAAIGNTIALEGQRFEIVGVTPPGFFGVEVGRAFDVAVPICAEAAIAGGEGVIRRRDGWWLAVIGKLNAGWTRERAAAHLRTLSPAMLQATLPSVYGADTAKAYLAMRLTAEDVGAVSSLREQYETPLLLLLGTTGVVLLIACANLANLMLARATAREREIAVRLAIGASRSRLVRQLLTESILLAGIGAVAGAFIARGLSRVLVSFITTDRNPVFLDLSIDWRMLAFTAGLAVATCLLFGLAPAARATRTPPADAMKAGGRGNTADRSRFGIRRMLVAAQVALTLVLLVGAFMFGRTLQNLLAVETGFRQDGIVVADTDLRGDAPAQRPVLLRHLLARVRQTPGVQAAAYVRIIPLGGGFSNNDIMAEGVAAQPENRVVNFNRVSDGYFSTMNIPMLAGRDFDARDTPESPRVAIVSERLAERFFGRDNSIGRRFRESADAGRPEVVYEIVGLVRNSKFDELRENDEPLAFVAATQQERPDLPAFLVRSATPAPAMIAALKETFREVDPRVVIQFSVLDQRIRELSLRERLIAMLSAGFGLLAVLLSTIGVYGVMSYIVARRRNEIGVRMALGASRVDVSRMILADVGVVLAIGLTLGAGLSIAAARSASSLLFQLQPGDPGTLVSAAALLAAVGLFAGYLPARRAARLDPLSALREE